MVVGGGNSAAEDALYLARLCDRVILVHRRDKLRASRVLADAVLSNPKISFVPNAQVVGLVSEGGLSAVKIARENREETLSASALFVSIGRAPASELFRGQLDIDGGGYIIAGEDTKTSLPGVFAAGDVRTKALRQVVTAAADGAVSAHFAEEYLSALDL